MLSKKTKILATIGPASDNIDTIERMVMAGVNAFRMNFSHGTHEYHKSNLDKIRAVEAKLGRRLGIFQDISGPKIRVGKIDGIFDLERGDRLIFVQNEIVGFKKAEHTYLLSINHPEILNLMQVGEYIYLCDGAIRAKVVKIGTNIEAELENSGILTSNKGINFPNTRINIDVITQKDRLDLEWGAKNGVNFVGISFVQRASDIKNVREILSDLGSTARVYAKIEKFDAVENIDEIIEASDGIMVARGDLGIEVPYYEVPSIQKMIIRKANERGRPVITATQMMLSMTQNERATRAEISDVANAVLDGTDAVMLSEESAVGINPVAVVEAMAQTIRETEKIYPYGKYDEFDFFDETDMITSSTTRLAQRLRARNIIAITGSGKSAIKLARNRCQVQILAVAHDEETAHSLTLVWGVEPVIVTPKDYGSMVANVIVGCLNHKYIDEKSTYVLTAGVFTGIAGNTNYIRIIKQDQIQYYKKAVKGEI